MWMIYFVSGFIFLYFGKWNVQNSHTDKTYIKGVIGFISVRIDKLC